MGGPVRGAIVPSLEPGSGRRIELVGGVVAFNEERRLGAAVTSLLDQELPPEARWRRIWVVVSGSTDGTAAVARALAGAHPEVRVIVQPERQGKAAALREVLRVTLGDFLILLNGDAIAAPGSVAELLRTAAPLPPPYAVMARPEPEDLPPGVFGHGIQLLWNLHHRLHAELVTRGEGNHLSDELLLLSTWPLLTLPEDVVNEGAFIGAWLRKQGGSLAYAVDSRVAIEVPWNLPDHLRQRRRIHVGHRQVATLFGVAPTTIGRYLVKRPGRALALMVDELRASRGSGPALLWLAVGELASAAAALWDWLPPRRSHRLWTPIRERSGSRGPSGPTIAGNVGSGAPSEPAA